MQITAVFAQGQCYSSRKSNW